MKSLIGMVTRYQGTEVSYLRGHCVRIIGVIRNGAKSGVDADALEHIKDNDTLIRLGGVTENDRLMVQVWLTREGRFAFITDNVLAVDCLSFFNEVNDEPEAGLMTRITRGNNNCVMSLI